MGEEMNIIELYKYILSSPVMLSANIFSIN